MLSIPNNFSFPSKATNERVSIKHYNYDYLAIHTVISSKIRPSQTTIRYLFRLNVFAYLIISAQKQCIMTHIHTSLRHAADRILVLGWSPIYIISFYLGITVVSLSEQYKSIDHTYHRVTKISPQPTNVLVISIRIVLYCSSLVTQLITYYQGEGIYYFIT